MRKKRGAAYPLIVPTERAEQVALAAWLRARRLLWCAVPNGGRRHPLEAKKLKAEGVQPGVPDLLIFSVPPRDPTARGVAIEMKRLKGGRVSLLQREWLDALTLQGWRARVCVGAREAVDWLTGELGF